MIKKTIQYYTPDGDRVVEDFYFNVSKDELLDLNVKENKGVEQIGIELASTQDGERAWNLLKELLLMTVGEKTPDGKGFTKVDLVTGIPIARTFQAKAAFGDLILELMQDTQRAVEFFNSLIPQSLKDEVAKIELEKASPPAPEPQIVGEIPVTPVAPEPEPEKTVDEYTEKELLDMSDEDFQKLVGTNTKGWSHRTLTIAFQRKSRG